MSFVLDTDVISELRRSPDEHVSAWVRRQSATALYLSTITILELEVGVVRLERRDPRRGRVLRRWLDEDVAPSFLHRTLPVTVEVARRAAPLHVPDPKPERDALVAATALAAGFTVVTRNVRDFEVLGVAVINPWSV